MALISVENVTKRFGAEVALDNINADVDGGVVTGLVGPDGAGKTTLIRLITGLLHPDEGRITVFGHDTRTDAQAVQNEIGYMPQRFGLYEDLTVQENLNLYADLRGLPQATRAATFDRLLSFTDLKQFTGRYAGKLSGGMKQKLGLACALIRTPRVLLLDEPSVGVDPISRRELWRMVQELKGEGIAVIWSTAYLDEAEKCDQTLLLNAGKLLYQGPPHDLTDKVAGRSFKITGLKEERRAGLSDAMDAEGIIDGVIQGSAIRIVTRNVPSDGAEGLHRRLGSRFAERSWWNRWSRVSKMPLSTRLAARLAGIRRLRKALLRKRAAGLSSRQMA